MNATATPKRVMISEIAACTGFFMVMTPTAPTKISTAEVMKMRMPGTA